MAKIYLVCYLLILYVLNLYIPQTSASGIMHVSHLIALSLFVLLGNRYI